MRFFSISLVGYYAYMYGLIPSDSSSNSYELSGRCYISPSLRKLSDIFTLFFLLLFVIQGGLDILNRYKVDDYNFSSYANSLFYLVLFYTISSMCNIMLVPDLNKDAIKKTIKSLSNLYIFNSIIILLLFLISGARSQLLQIALPIFFLYFSYIKKVKNKYIIFGIILGLVLMSIIGFVRMGESFASTNVGIVDYLRDFIFENAAGIWLVDYSDSYGITYGSNAILQIVSFIPFAQSFLLFFIDKSSIAESSSILYTFSIRDDGSGMGTNIIGDLYYTFGPIGVVVLMFLMGFVIRKLSRDRSTYGLLALIVLIGNAIFSTRVEFFYIIRMVGFSLIIFWILKKIPRLAKK